MITKNQSIPLNTIKIEQDTLNCWSVFFERPIGFTFEAGDWVDLQFNDRMLNGGKTYTIASSPTEGDIRITFREGISEFKKALQQIQPNTKLTITQYGNDYNFTLKKHQSSTLIAGGVGIAPFRSMIKEMYDNEDQNETTLIYLNQNDDFLFKQELELWKATLPRLTIHYIVTKDINRKKREKLLNSLTPDLSQNFYISGPTAMVEANEHLLIDRGVDVRNIRIDSFGGY